MRTDPDGLARSCFRGEFTGTEFLPFPSSLADRLSVLVSARGGFWEKKPERWRPELPNQNRKRKVTLLMHERPKNRVYPVIDVR